MWTLSILFIKWTMTLWKLASKILHSFNTSSSSPLVFHQVQKRDIFDIFFHMTHTQALPTYCVPHTQSQLGCGLCSKLGEPKPLSGLGFEVLRIKKIVIVQKKKLFHSIQQEFSLTAPLHAAQICRSQ
jgi:hypothetical protein